MPMYEYQCPAGHYLIAYATIADRHTPQLCRRCGDLAQKVILTAPKVFGDYEGYESPVSGRWISGKKARLEDLRSNNCRPYELGEKEEFVRRQAGFERAEDQFIDQVVDSTIADLTK